MYGGMHYASDVTVGALVGLGCITIGLLAVRAGEEAARRRATAHDLERPEPSMVGGQPLVAGGAR